MNESLRELREATKNMLDLARVYATFRRGLPAAPAPAGWRWCTKCRERLARRNQRWCARCRTRGYDTGRKPWEQPAPSPPLPMQPRNMDGWVMDHSGRTQAMVQRSDDAHTSSGKVGVDGLESFETFLDAEAAREIPPDPYAGSDLEPPSPVILPGDPGALELD